MSAARILAVDDNATIRRALALRLGARGYEIITAAHGAEALEQINREAFDLVLLDLEMPGVHGHEVLRAIRLRFDQPELPVIVLSATSDPAVIQQTLTLGANDYVVKPGDLPVLLARIKSQLSLKQTTTQLRQHVPAQRTACGLRAVTPSTESPAPAPAAGAAQALQQGAAQTGVQNRTQGGMQSRAHATPTATQATSAPRTGNPYAGPTAGIDAGARTPANDEKASVTRLARTLPAQRSRAPISAEGTCRVRHPKPELALDMTVPAGMQSSPAPAAAPALDLDTEITRDFMAQLEATSRWGSHKPSASKGFVSDLDFRVWYDNTPTLSLTITPSGEIISVNRFGAEFFGYKPVDLIGEPIFKLYAEDAVDEAYRFLENVCRNPGRPLRWEVRRRRRSGGLLWVRETARAIEDLSGGIHILVNCEDIDETYRLSDKLAHQSLHDELTGLPNRKQLEQRLDAVIESARREGTRHVLAYLDLDQFRLINDTQGHAAGDALIREVAKLMSARIRRRDTLVRMGGDEFALLLEDCALEEGLALLNSVRADVAGQPFEWRGQTLEHTVSAGMVAIDEQTPSVEELLSMVDTACYAAKDGGRNRVHVFQPDDELVALRHGEMRWAHRVADALREDLFQLNCQAIRPTKASAKEGDHYEILVRMRDGKGGLIPPGVFLPAAERFNLAGKVDRWVVANTLAWLKANPRAASALELCSINLSGQSIGDADVLEFIQAELERSGVPAHKICFEITETAAIANLGSATHFITELKAAGCRFALDDFGSGFSSFAYLKTLPVDYLKIDGAFVRDILRDSINCAMVRSINEIGHVMGKQTIAEFVEDEATLDLLREIGVDFVQGYGIGRPAPLEESVPFSRKTLG